MSFLKNVWYIAAWDDEVVASEKLVRRLLDERLLFFRDATGAAVALVDRCPHRYAPLHRGTVQDGIVECGYHGLKFDGRGVCVFNPHGEGQIPSNAKVQTYPVVERHKALWIWMGDPALADPALIPDFSSLADEDAKVVRGYLNPKTHYELMTDNLLDLGHTAYLHPDSLGSDAIVHSTRSARRDGDKVVYELWAPDGEPPLATKFLLPWTQQGNVDHWLTSTWHAPSLIHQVTGFAPVGRQREGGDSMDGYHLLTPETATTTHYFHALGRRFRKDDAQLDLLIKLGVEQAFANQDFPMVESIQDDLGDENFGAAKRVLLTTDAGAEMARRTLQQMRQREAEAAAR